LSHVTKLRIADIDDWHLNKVSSNVVHPDRNEDETELHRCRDLFVLTVAADHAIDTMNAPKALRAL
jgi:hypothetical protein